MRRTALSLSGTVPRSCPPSQRGLIRSNRVVRYLGWLVQSSPCGFPYPRQLSIYLLDSPSFKVRASAGFDTSPARSLIHRTVLSASQVSEASANWLDRKHRFPASRGQSVCRFQGNPYSCFQSNHQTCSGFDAKFASNLHKTKYHWIIPLHSGRLVDTP